MGTAVPLPRGKVWPWHDADYSFPSSVEAKNEQKLYLLSPQMPPWHAAGPLYFYLLLLTAFISLCLVMYLLVPKWPLLGPLPLTSLSCCPPPFWPQAAPSLLLAPLHSPHPHFIPSLLVQFCLEWLLQLKLIPHTQLTHHPDNGGSKDLWNTVNFYQTTWCYNPEDSHHQLLK
jgi:hypothetical protein